MKRIAALILAVLVALGALAACAESTGTRMDMSKLRLSTVGGDDEKRVKLKDMSLSLALGSAEGVPTLQATLYSEEQIDFVVQIVGDKLLLAMGGVVGTYCVDLGTLLGNEMKGTLLAAGMSAGILSFGSNPDMMMQMWMQEGKKGKLEARIEIPRELCQAVTERVEGLLAQTPELLGGDDARSKEPVSLEIAYQPQEGKISFRLLQGEQGVQIKANVTMTTGPMDFVNISADEAQFDLMNLKEEALESLKNDLEFMSMKAQRFASITHMDELTQASAR